MTVDVVELGSMFAETKGCKPTVFVDPPQKQGIAPMRFALTPSGAEDVL
jgi:hypothetical protein